MTQRIVKLVVGEKMKLFWKKSLGIPFANLKVRALLGFILFAIQIAVQINLSPSAFAMMTPPANTGGGGGNNNNSTKPAAEEMFQRFKKWKEIETAVLSGHAEAAIKELSENRSYHFKESTDAIFKRIEREMNLIATGKRSQADFRIILAGLGATKILARRENATEIKSIQSKLEILVKAEQRKLWEETLRPFLDDLVKIAESREKSLGSFYAAVIAVSEITIKNAADLSIDALETKPVLLQKAKVPTHIALKEMMEWMSARVRGQSAAIQSLAELELRRLVFPERETADSIWFMGMPGTGKDSMARQYVNSIYRDPLAYKKHLLKIGALKSDHDLWTQLGSPTGFKGSSSISPLLKFLVQHSCGRYVLQEVKDGPGQTVEQIVEDPTWKSSEPCREYTYRPDQAVLYLDELHNWARECKDLFIKPALEEGKWFINNPNGGLREIHVPITFIMASNDGASLLSSKDADGVRIRKSANEAQLKERHAFHSKDPKKLINELLRARRLGEIDVSNSTEMIDRVATIVLTAPLGRADLKQIIHDTLEEFRATLGRMTDLSMVTFTWDDDLENRILDFQYDAEDNARPIKNKVRKLVIDPLMQFIANGKLLFPAKIASLMKLSIVPLEDQSWSLQATVTSGPIEALAVTWQIEASKALIPAKRMEAAEINSLMTLGARMSQHVFGVQDVIEKVSRALIVMEERRRSYKEGDLDAPSARIFAFLGLSSTGKTQTPKAIARELYGSEEAMVTIDFSQIRTVHDLKEKILGSTINGRVVQSEFMKLHDLNQGRVLFVFDEIANAPRDVIMALYDILREAVVTTFSDGRPRSMNNTIIVMTGNASQEFYQTIPHDIPLEEKLAALREVYKKLQSDPDLVMRFLQNYFSPATLRRIGAENIFLFPPLDSRALRELTQAKILAALKSMRPRDSAWGWNIRFQNSEAYLRTLELIEIAAFNADEQGASIDRFAKQAFAESLRHLLLSNTIAANSDVVLHPLGEETVVIKGVRERSLRFKVYVRERPDPLILTIPLMRQSHYIGSVPDMRKTVGMHEAGHNLVRKVLFGDLFEDEELTILPGVTEINGRMIRYEGLAVHNEKLNFPMSMAAMVREMATLLAGRVAQQLTSNGAFTDAGQSNDLQRASRLAQLSIVAFGLHDDWGLEVADLKQEKLSEYIARLSDEKKTLLNKLVAGLMLDAEKIARVTLLKNFDTLVAMGNHLIEEGRLNGPQIEEFYKGRKIEIPTDDDLDTVDETWKARMPKKKSYLTQSLIPSLRSDIAQPKKIADLKEILALEKFNAIMGMEIPADAPIVDRDQSPSGATCEAGLSHH